jgi:hypothetical protein
VPSLLARLEDVHRQVRHLPLMVEWALDLIARIQRMQLIFELADTEVEFDHLELEAQYFCLVAKRIAWRPAA